jgi:hypothetical protein
MDIKLIAEAFYFSNRHQAEKDIHLHLAVANCSGYRRMKQQGCSPACPVRVP